MPLRWPPRWWPIQPIPDHSPTPAPTPNSTDITQQLLLLHNSQRAKKGLAPLILNPQLQVMAQAHADAQAKIGKMSHDWAGDGSYSSRLNHSGYAYTNAAENVAWNQPTAYQVMIAWMYSPGHRANILGKFTEGGFAVAYGANNDPYWCTDFGLPLGEGEVQPQRLPGTSVPTQSYTKALYGHLVSPVKTSAGI